MRERETRAFEEVRKGHWKRYLLLIIPNIQQQRIGIQDKSVIALGQDPRNFLCSLDSSECDVSGVALDCFADEFGGHGFSLRRDNHC